MKDNTQSNFIPPSARTLRLVHILAPTGKRPRFASLAEALAEGEMRIEVSKP